MQDFLNASSLSFWLTFMPASSRILRTSPSLLYSSKNALCPSTSTAFISAPAANSAFTISGLLALNKAVRPFSSVAFTSAPASISALTVTRERPEELANIKGVVPQEQFSFAFAPDFNNSFTIFSYSF